MADAIGGAVLEAVAVLAACAGGWACFRLNQWLVSRKGLDHRPWYVPSHWGPLGTVLIVLAAPRGWHRRP